jgi:formate dehydrogenase subunit gamma
VVGGLNRFTVEPVYCLGLCVTSSSALLGSEPLGRLDANKITVALDEARIV